MWDGESKKKPRFITKRGFCVFRLSFLVGGDPASPRLRRVNRFRDLHHSAHSAHRAHIGHSACGGTAGCVVIGGVGDDGFGGDEQ